MKPQNLLIFKDYNVKIGDFGCSIKFSNTSTDDTKAYLRGVTEGYSSKEICALYREDLEVSKKKLFENDCYCLF